jgi:hypothetical protein
MTVVIGTLNSFKKYWLLALLPLLAGCPKSVEPPPKEAPLYVAPLPVQQAAAYPETVTRRFVSLADFETQPAEQVSWFTFSGQPRSGESSDRTPASRKLVVNVTRTGAGAMEVLLPAGMQLVFSVPQIHDFSGYTLLSLALYSETLRDDLRITVTSDASSWRSLPTLIQPGWNTVLVDIRRLGQLRDFDIKGVRTLKLEFADAAGPVRFNLDDIMLLDNRRPIAPLPAGLRMEKNALDYKITLQGRPEPLEVRQNEDGLWRIGQDQPLVQLAAPKELLPESVERLAPMGTRRVGAVEILENNPLRLRIANTWYFPSRAGEWASLAVRRIRWEYTFYSDKRFVTHLEFDNAGSSPLGALRIRWPQSVALAGASLTQEIELPNPPEVKRWDYLTASPDPQRDRMQRNFLHPGKLVCTLGEQGAFAPGDADRDGFDESEGCYFLLAREGHCRFTVVPPEGGLVDPVFRVAGDWRQMPTVSCEGLAIRDAVRLADGSVLVVLRGLITRPTAVEVEGPGVR